MSTTTTRPRAVGAKLVCAADIEPSLAGDRAEASYRRGVHQAIAFAYELVERSGSVREALLRLADAEGIAGDLRRARSGEGDGVLLDLIRSEMFGTNADRRTPSS